MQQTGVADWTAVVVGGDAAGGGVVDVVVVAGDGSGTDSVPRTGAVVVVSAVPAEQHLARTGTGRAAEAIGSIRPLAHCCCYYYC